LQRVHHLPKSCQQAITGELQFLTEAKHQRQASKKDGVLVSHSTLKEKVYGKLSYRRENFIEVVDSALVSRE